MTFMRKCLGVSFIEIPVVSNTNLCLCPDGYINGSGSINTGRLQVVLDEMVSWEQEVFKKEYSDLNWFKGK